jgi:glycosyltransferase involved in cell wall biosynthesis
VEALRAAGVDAHYAYVGGYKLQTRLAHHDFAHALIEKAQNPFSFFRTVGAIERMIERHGFDYLHSHLTYDHWLGRFAAGGHRVRLARTFHARRVLRSDPFTSSLLGRSQLLFVVNDEFRAAPVLRGRDAVFTPPPVDLIQFTPDGPDVRQQYGFSKEETVITAIGKLSKDRGFEAVLETFALLRRGLPTAKLMIIGHGEHRPALEELAHRLEITPAVTWAGYHEDDLAEHYRAADALLFTARGSDEGHRAVLEAMACGVPAVCYPIEGISALVGELAPMLIAENGSPASLALRIPSVLKEASLRERVAVHARTFGYDAAASRLIKAYGAQM